MRYSGIEEVTLQIETTQRTQRESKCKQSNKTGILLADLNGLNFSVLEVAENHYTELHHGIWRPMVLSCGTTRYKLILAGDVDILQEI